jgi:alpha-ketoglutarate-dependent 2,4-dichlorophenoxyacetate dioxygenase
LNLCTGRTLPSVPPDTEYADMRAAWADLPASLQQEIAGLKVEHSIAWSRGLLGRANDSFSDESLKRRPPVVHPLVRTHPVTGRCSLYLSGHASHVVGWPFERGRKLLDELTAHATQRQYVYAHKWQPHDLLMWDDSSSMHRALPYEGAEPRVLRWSGVRELAQV